MKETMGLSKEERIKEENLKMRKLRQIVDLTGALLHQQPLTLEAAQELIDAAKKSVLALFPDSEEQFNLIYLPRFYRILRERKILPEN